jgi:nucleoside-diphosphate-sugar epimerase
MPFVALSSDAFHLALCAGELRGPHLEIGPVLHRVEQDAVAVLHECLPWFAIYALAPFSETFREMLEMRYLWRETALLDSAKLVAFLGEEPHTPLDSALRKTLRGLSIVAIHGRALAASANSRAQA